jgi:hypothetical protein
VRTSCLAATLVTLHLAAALPAQQPAVLAGVVTNLNGVPLAGAEVAIVKYALRVVTNDSGVYSFEAVPAGKVTVLVRHIGFRMREEGVSLDAGKRRQLDFELAGLPEMLDSVMIREAGGKGRMAEFWARRMIGSGVYLTRADIEKRGPYRSSDLLRALPGVRVTMGEGLDRPVISMGRTPVGTRTYRNVQTLAADCRVSYYVDGMFVPAGTFHIDDLSVVSIEAIEVYRGPAEIPPRFRQRDTACGLIVIWTREPPPRPKEPPGTA